MLSIKMNRLLFVQNNLVLCTVKRYFSNCIFNQEHTVSPFCSLFVTCPFNVKIRPLDVHKYPNCDKLIINVYSDESKTKVDVTCMQDGNRFSIFGKTSDLKPIDCVIDTPVKSDINIVTTVKGNIDIEKINGSKILLQSELGDIVSNNCQTSKISFKSSKGNITTSGTLHAAKIELKTRKDAKISANHLQALKADVITENGDITIKSSYCDDTIFRTKSGKLFLDNVHKNCSIFVTENGFLQMTGFDGTLNVDIKEGDIDIQASKLYDLSKIISAKKGKILLRLSDWIQENTEIKATCQELKVADEVKLIIKNKDVYAVLTPQNCKFTSELEINSCLSNVNIEGASWSDMLKLKGINFKD